MTRKREEELLREVEKLLLTGGGVPLDSPNGKEAQAKILLLSFRQSRRLAGWTATAVIAASTSALAAVLNLIVLSFGAR